MSNSLFQSLIFGKYRISELLGKGSSSTVYMGKNINSGENVAIKIEELEKQGNLLESEAYHLFQLKGNGVPEVKSFGRHGKYKLLVLTLLGNSIDKYFKIMNKNFTIKDICMIAIQLIERLDYIHSKDIIHRDIKPGNLLEDIKTKRILYLIDFGLAKKYRSSKTGNHIKFALTKKLTGTARFASTNALRGVEQSRRDDLESAGYFLIYLAKKGLLPWQNIKIKDKMEIYKQIYMIKKNIEPEKLCSQLPIEFSQYIKYVRELKFEEDPNYNYMKGLFINILTKLGFKNDLFFSWLIKEKKYIDPNMLKINQNKRVSPQARIIQRLKVENKGKENDINNDKKTSNRKFETISENLETELFKTNSSNLVENQLSNVDSKTDQQMLNEKYSERKTTNISKNNSKSNNIKGETIVDYTNKANNEIESKPIIFDPTNYTFKDSNFQLNPETEDKIIPKNINNLNKLCNQLLSLNKNNNLTNKAKTPITLSNIKHLYSNKNIVIKNKNKIKIKLLNKNANDNSPQKLLNQNFSKESTPTLAKDQKYNKNNNGNISEIHTFINSLGKRGKIRQNLNSKSESHHNQTNDSLSIINPIKKNYVSNSEMTNLTLNKNTEYISKKRLILDASNHGKKPCGNNRFEKYNNSTGNNRNINSLRNDKRKNIIFSGLSASSFSSAFEKCITYRNNQNNLLYNNNSKKERVNSNLNQGNTISTDECFNYQSPQVIQDLKNENQKPNNFKKNIVNKNNNNASTINTSRYNYSNIDTGIQNYNSKKKGNLNLYQYNNYFIKYNINCNKDNHLISPDLSINSNNKSKQSSFSKNCKINKSNDFKRIYNNNNIVNRINNNNVII